MVSWIFLIKILAFNQRFSIHNVISFEVIIVIIIIIIIVIIIITLMIMMMMMLMMMISVYFYNLFPQHVLFFCHYY